MSLIKCAECGHMLSDRAAACPSCGAPNEAVAVPRCAACHAVVRNSDRYCPNCGNPAGNDPEGKEPVASGRNRLAPYLIAAALILILIIVSAVVIKKIDRPVDASVASKDSTAAAEEQKQEQIKRAQDRKIVQQNMEREQPSKFLKHEYTSKNNLIGETVVTGTLVSAATQSAYHHNKFRVIFQNRKGEEIGKEEFMLTDTIAPGDTLEYRKKLSGPKGSRDAEIVLISSKTVAR